jgi:hypothetical protein
VLLKTPCRKLQGVFDRKVICRFQIRSLILQPAQHCRKAEPAGNALAFAVQMSPDNTARETLWPCWISKATPLLGTATRVSIIQGSPSLAMPRH